MNHIRFAHLALGCLVMALAACDEDDPVTPEPVSFSADVQPILTENCVGCHGGDTPAAGMNLAAGQAFANTVDVRAVQTDTSTLLDRIEPGNPEASYLIHKIQGTQTASPTIRGRGQRMPLGCPTAERRCLTAEEIQLIRQWVVEGALNN
jgi:hypothetical protein